ncbi:MULTISPECIES: hypothetical protein [unclassified Microcoleus]|uniref:hypothetical protein n=1 Tax=unclassified Microcoleus TaxID=2642155 RepID=UPI002FD3607C
MNLQQRQRLGSAIATTILSCAAVPLAGVEKAQAAVLTYNFEVETVGVRGFFKFSNSLLTGIEYERLAVSEGRLNGFTAPSNSNYQQQGKEYYDLVGSTVVFLQGEFIGILASGNDGASGEVDLPDVPGGPFYVKYESWASWYTYSGGAIIDGIKRSSSSFQGSIGTVIRNRERILAIDARRFINGDKVSYTLVDTAAEPVPEPITATGTALALAGLSWLKHKKKMAV